jgi:CHAD domain-containing protein
MINNSVESALAGILTDHLRGIEHNYNGTLNGSDPRCLHDMRVAIRRARFALKLFAPLVNKKKCNKIRESLGVLSLRSGEVRDLDISIARLKKLFTKKQFSLDIRKKLFSELSYRHKKARRRMLETLTSSLYADTIRLIREFIKELKEISPEPCKDGKIGKTFNNFTKELSGKLLKWGKWNIKKLSSKNLHKMRIDFKRARYLTEFILTCGLAQKDTKKDMAMFAFFQDILGKHHDALTVTKKVKKASENIGLYEADVEKIIKSEKMRAKKSRKEFLYKWRKLRETPNLKA